MTIDDCWALNGDDKTIHLNINPHMELMDMLDGVDEISGKEETQDLSLWT